MEEKYLDKKYQIQVGGTQEVLDAINSRPDNSTDKIKTNIKSLNDNLNRAKEKGLIGSNDISIEKYPDGSEIEFDIVYVDIDKLEENFKKLNSDTNLSEKDKKDLKEIKELVEKLYSAKDKMQFGKKAIELDVLASKKRTEYTNVWGEKSSEIDSLESLNTEAENFKKEYLDKLKELDIDEEEIEEMEDETVKKEILLLKENFEKKVKEKEDKIGSVAKALQAGIDHNKIVEYTQKEKKLHTVTKEEIKCKQSLNIEESLKKFEIIKKHGYLDKKELEKDGKSVEDQEPNTENPDETTPTVTTKDDGKNPDKAQKGATQIGSKNSQDKGNGTGRETVRRGSNDSQQVFYVTASPKKEEEEATLNPNDSIRRIYVPIIKEEMSLLKRFYNWRAELLIKHHNRKKDVMDSINRMKNPDSSNIRRRDKINRQIEKLNNKIDKIYMKVYGTKWTAMKNTEVKPPEENGGVVVRSVAEAARIAMEEQLKSNVYPPQQAGTPVVTRPVEKKDERVK